MLKLSAELSALATGIDGAALGGLFADANAVGRLSVYLAGLIAPLVGGLDDGMFGQLSYHHGAVGDWTKLDHAETGGALASILPASASDPKAA